MTDHNAVTGGGPTYKPFGVVLQSVSLPEFFAKVGAFVAMRFGEQRRLCVLTVPCLCRRRFNNVARITGVAVDYVWLR